MQDDEWIFVRNARNREGYIPISSMEMNLVDMSTIESEMPKRDPDALSVKESSGHHKKVGSCSALVPPKRPQNTSAPPPPPPRGQSASNLRPPPPSIGQTILPPPTPSGSENSEGFPLSMPSEDSSEESITKLPPPSLPARTRSLSHELQAPPQLAPLQRRPPPIQKRTKTQVLSSLEIPPPPPPSTTGNWRLNLNPTESAKLPEMLKKRSYIFQELVSTESTYCHSLELLHTKYYLPLKSDHRGLSDDDFYSLFSNLDFLLGFHKSFLETMNQKLSEWNDDSCVGDMLLTVCPKLKLYHHYVVNQETAMQVFVKRQEIKSFRKFVESLDYTEALGGLSFESLLICPIQRIPRYVLLIQDMLDHTPTAHPDYPSLKKALELIRDLANLLNAEKRKNENIEKLKSIQEKIEGLPSDLDAFNESREPIQDVDCKMGKDKCHVFFFTDIAVVTKKSGNKFQYKKSMPMLQITILVSASFLKLIHFYFHILIIVFYHSISTRIYTFSFTKINL